MNNSKEFEVEIPRSLKIFISGLSLDRLELILSPLGVEFIVKGESEYFPFYVEYLVVAPTLSSAIAAREFLDSFRKLLRVSLKSLEENDKSIASPWFFGCIRDSF